MKTLYKTILLLIISISIFNCSKDDDSSNQTLNPLLGQWEITSGDFIYGSDKYIYFNTDNTANILRQTNDNFKGIYSPNYSISNGEVTIDGTGGQGSPGLFNYVLDGNTLTLSSSTSTKTLQKIDNGQNSSDWVETLNILSQGNAPWEGDVDIAFTYDKTAIVYGKTNASDHIGLINPETFEEIGQIATTNSARAVEIEKYDGSLRYVFQSNNGSDNFHAYYNSNNNLAFDSLETGAWIKGPASQDADKIWVASSNESSLYLYNYVLSPHLIEHTIALEIQPEGLDYQNGHLYVCDGQFVHKCQIAPNFQVVSSYRVQDTTISGIAFDGINFWVSGYNYSNSNHVIVKTNLTL
ncbi:hypothetical protein N7U66_08230 [Lacinutrix neustonica]|uniref:Lipocalin-like domain-containing protein n=1 Tax=Lacinutrix neustonica TaxID=2980107 RepID=A0A9E8MXG6_9FLAO|nr:hypothetical protein [Lacinutrix neustonica]WAC03463.1 hypothetical protein N7U66_08230 [Lacinutrix neustonica]